MMKRALWLSVGCLMVLTLVLPCKAAEKPVGKVKIATSAAWWAGKGGDFSTHKGGNCIPLMNTYADSLITKDTDAKIVPALASSWKYSEDGKSLEFFLNKNAKFHNGDPVTSKDVKFTLETYALDKKAGYCMGELHRLLESIEIVDNHDIIIHFNKPLPAFLDRLYDYLKIMPKDYFEKVGDEGFADKPIAAGPFRWVDYEQDAWVKFEAVEDHYRHTLHQVPGLRACCRACNPPGNVESRGSRYDKRCSRAYKGTGG